MAKSKLYVKEHRDKGVAKKHASKIKKRGGKITEMAEVGIPKKTRIKYEFKSK